MSGCGRKRTRSAMTASFAKSTRAPALSPLPGLGSQTTFSVPLWAAIRPCGQNVRPNAARKATKIGSIAKMQMIANHHRFKNFIRLFGSLTNWSMRIVCMNMLCALSSCHPIHVKYSWFMFCLKKSEKEEMFNILERAIFVNYTSITLSDHDLIRIKDDTLRSTGQSGMG